MTDKKRVIIKTEKALNGCVYSKKKNIIVFLYLRSWRAKSNDVLVHVYFIIIISSLSG